MKLFTIAIGAVSALALTAGVAAAQMQPIPNPPEKPAAHKMKHHKKHHHHAKKAEGDKAMASDKSMASDKGAMASEKKPDKK